MNTFDPDSSQSEPSGLQVELGAKHKRHSATLWLVRLSVAFGVPLLVVVGAVVLRGEAPGIPSTATPAPTAIDLSSAQFFLHGTGSPTNPSVLFLDAVSPTATTPKSKDSAAVKFAGGNPWSAIGTWTANIGGSNTAIPTALHTWLGLKNSDDIGTAFDVRVEVYQNQTLVASGQSLCITGITRNPTQAKPVSVPLSVADVLTGTGTISLKVLTRIGTKADGMRCSGPGATHSNAVGLRMYFDATNRKAKLLLSTSSPKVTWSQDQLEVILSPGETAMRHLTFTSSLLIQNIVVEPVPGIAKFVSVQPNSFTSVPAGQPQSVKLTFSIPQSTPLGTYEGTVHVRLGSQTLPQTLKIHLNVWQRFQNTPVFYSLAVPPTFVVAELVSPARTFEQPDLQSLISLDSPAGVPGIYTVSVFGNPRELPIGAWVDAMRPGFYRADTVLANTSLCETAAERYKSAGGAQLGVYFARDNQMYAVEWHSFDPADSTGLFIFEGLLSGFRCT